MAFQTRKPAGQIPSVSKSLVLRPSPVTKALKTVVGDLMYCRGSLWFAVPLPSDLTLLGGSLYFVVIFAVSTGLQKLKDLFQDY